MRRIRLKKEEILKAIKHLTITALILIVVIPAFGHALAQEKYRLKALGNQRPAPQFKLFEWMGEELEKRTNGQVKTDVVSLGEVGLTGFEAIRVSKAGLVDFNEVPVVYISGDIPLLESINLPGLYKDYETALKANLDFLEVCKKYEESLGGRVLGAFLYPDQVLYSRKPIRKPEDLKGLNIRVSSSVAMGEFFRALGAHTTTIPTAEVYTALERGTVDAALTGTMSGFSLKWYEVTKYLVDLNYGPLLSINVVSKKSWDKWPSNIRKILTELADEFTDRGAKIYAETTEAGIEGNKKNGMEWIPINSTMKAVVNDILKEVIVPSWVKRSGPDAKPTFNKYIAPYVGFKLD